MNKSFFDYFKEYWAQKRYFLCIGTILFIIVSVVSAIFFVYALLDFIIGNYQKVFFAVSVLGLSLYYIKEHFNEKKRARQEALELARQMQEAADADVLERNYRLLRTCLFTVIRDMSDVLGVKKPIREGEIDSPNHNISKLNFVLYQYIVYRTNSTVDTETIRSILRQEISRRLEAQLFAGMQQTYHFYEGQAEPIISVYTVEDNNAYYTISVAIADNNYCQHIRQGASLGLLQQAKRLCTPNDNVF